jgi:hypothetical protein
VNKFARFFFEQEEYMDDVENAKSAFNNVLQTLANHLQNNWTEKLNENINWNKGQKTWYAERNDNYPQYQWIGPEHWRVEKDNNELRLGFVHSTTADALRNKKLSFRLRLPPQRNLHTEKDENDKSFNDYLRCFLKKRKEKIQDTFDGRAEIDFDSSTLLEKTYPLETKKISEDYLNKLANACNDFCENPELIEVINDAFENAYKKIYGTSDDLPGNKPKKLNIEM